MLKKWLEPLLRPATTPRSDQNLRIACAALLYEVARADGQVAPEEERRWLHLLSQRWQLDAVATRELAERSREAARQAVDDFEFLRTLRNELDAPQRVELIRQMWSLAHADGRVDPHEEALIRKIADLLYVPHSQFILAREQERPA